MEKAQTRWDTSKRIDTMEAKIDKLLSLIEGSEKRMAQEMAKIKLAVDTIKPDIT